MGLRSASDTRSLLGGAPARPLFPPSGMSGWNSRLGSVASLHPAVEAPKLALRGLHEVGGVAAHGRQRLRAHQFVLGPEAPEAWRGLDLACTGWPAVSAGILSVRAGV